MAKPLGLDADCMSPVPCEVFPWRHGVPIGPRGPRIPAEAILVVEIILPARSNIGMHGNDEVDVELWELFFGEIPKNTRARQRGGTLCYAYMLEGGRIC